MIFDDLGDVPRVRECRYLKHPSTIHEQRARAAEQLAEEAPLFSHLRGEFQEVLHGVTHGDGVPDFLGEIPCVELQAHSPQVEFVPHDGPFLANLLVQELPSDNPFSVTVSRFSLRHCFFQKW